MNRDWTKGLIVIAVGLWPLAAKAQVYSYRSSPGGGLRGVRDRVILGGPLGPAPLDPYSVSSYFGWLPSPIVARQTVGHQIIATSPNGYVYRPIYADELDEQEPPPQNLREPATSFLSRHGLAAADLPLPQRPVAAPLDRFAADRFVGGGGRVDAAFTAALQGVRSGDYESALDALQSILDRDPKRGDAELLTAQSLFALGDYSGAVAALSRAVDLLPENQWDRYVADYRRYFPSALEYIVRLRLLERYVDDQPDDPSGPLLLGYHYGALGFSAEAKGLFDQVQGDREALAERLADHFARRRVLDDGPAPAPEDAVGPKAEKGPRHF